MSLLSSWIQFTLASFSFFREAALIVPVSTRSGTNQLQCPARRHVLVIFRELWSSYIFGPTDKIDVCFAVGESGARVFPIRKVTRLGNWWLQFLQRFLVIFDCVLEFSDGFLVLGVNDRSPRSWYFLYFGLYGFSIRVGIC